MANSKTPAITAEELAHYIALRDTIQALEKEREELAKKIKTHLLKNTHIPPTGGYVFQLRSTTPTVYSFQKVADTLGLDLALQVATIDTKALQKLAENQQVKQADLDKIAERGKTTHSLLLVPAHLVKSREQPGQYKST
ncbi:hypothetical protein [Deinococcus roseus]|uniref:DUF222 domain-containing protein n=1 Tax=Deinococcus roseus TaxID=392414 RepID=A0ABQ2D341_9DEIO|nr:hypothetical protein [Deinococcus roseus]GGJ44211.1 hypothetical protein GCM10008938_33090 [Deinococcus roseus]